MKEKDQAEDYRDKISTVDESGKRLWIFPKKPKGKYYNARTIVSIFLLLFLFGAPLLRLNGEQLLLFNIIERKFVIFGFIFWPQDFYLFVLAMLTTIIFIVLFTVIYGRVFCGWICPQTIFMEMVFRKIEYWIEGDASQQRKLDKAPWTREKAIKKISKQTIFFLISFLIGNTFLAYIVGSDKLLELVTNSPNHNLSLFIGVFVFSGMFYFVFSYFREQACTVVCPYGRLQGVLLDDDSIVVHYDYMRGEPRGKKKKEIDPVAVPLGDCVDCSLCVQVCPTGIDIRNGTQLECVNCTACIDACDEVMDKVGRPKELIRFASQNNIAKGQKFRFTPRILAYSAVLVIMLIVLGFSFASRSNFDTTILRARGALYNEVDEQTISNMYTIKMVNKTNESFPVELKMESGIGEIEVIGKELIVPPQELVEGVFLIKLKREDIESRNTKHVILVTTGDEIVDEVSTSFIGPGKKRE